MPDQSEQKPAEQEEFDVESVVREEEDDHDLLTYNESSARIAEEIKAVTAELETATGSRREALALRLQQMRDAAGRNTRWSAQDVNNSAFLGYRGPGSSLEE